MFFFTGIRLRGIKLAYAKINCKRIFTLLCHSESRHVGGTKNLGCDKIIFYFDVKSYSEILRCAQNDNRQFM
jgi:hypothetical protein